VKITLLSPRRITVASLLCATLAPAMAAAQDAGASVDAASVSAASTASDAAAPNASDGAVSEARAAQSLDEDPMARRLRRANVPQPFAQESPAVPPGTIVVRVLDGQGQIIPDCLVRVGSMREGERGEPVERRTGIDGLARFEGLERGSRVAYRVSTEFRGAKFAADPFQLPTNMGYEVQLVRLDVRSERSSILVTEARAEIGFQDDRIVLIQRFNIVNISQLGLDGDPHPFTFVPDAPLEFSLPPGASAFRTDEQSMGMTDLRAEERDGRVRVTGSISPTDPRNPVRLVWQYRVKFSESDVPIDLRFPDLPVLAATVVAQAPSGMSLEVEGMPQAEERSNNGQRILITGRQRASRQDENITGLRIRLRNIPATHGPERDAAAIVTALIAGAAVFSGVQRSRSSSKGRADQQRARKESDLRAERDRIIAEIRSVAREHARGDVGPETFKRLRQELSSQLAAVDRDLAGLDAGPSPRV
jgi:hypothetical protein